MTIFLDIFSSTAVSSPGETMPRSDSADSQSQAIQEEPLPSTSHEDEDPLAGKIKTSVSYFFLKLKYFLILILCFYFGRHKFARRCGSLFLGSSS